MVELAYSDSDIGKLGKVSSDLNSLKRKVDDLDVDKLKTVPVGLKKLSDGWKNWNIIQLSKIR